jgi:HNH endonuclease
VEKDNLWGDLDELEVGVSSSQDQIPVGEEVAVYSEVGEEVVEWSPEVSESPTVDLEEVDGENIDSEEESDTEQIGASESISELDDLEVETPVDIVGVSETPSVLSPFEDIDKILSGLKYDRELRMDLPIESIVITEFDKKARFATKNGLTASIEDFGRVLNPIDVLALPSVDGEEIEMYTLISGLRRVYGASRNGYKTIPAFVWHFADYEKAQRLVPLLGLILNKQQQHNYQEIWNGLSTLEHEYGLKFSQIERLYPYLESGDVLKLKEVCSESDTYPEPMTELFAGKYTLDKAYKELVKQRKERDVLEEEDHKGILSSTELGKEAVVSNEEGSSSSEGGSEEGENSGNNKLSAQEVDELLELADNSMDNLTLESALEQADAVDKGIVQDRKGDGDDDLTPEVKNKIKARDKMVCQCCSKDKVENQGAFLSQLVVHHKVPVHAGGTDDEKNLITLCIGCHHLLHTMEKMGTLTTDKEHLDTMDEEFRRRILNAWSLAYIAIKAGEKKGYSRKERAKKAQESLGHKFPGQDIKNDLALRTALDVSSK